MSNPILERCPSDSDALLPHRPLSLAVRVIKIFLFLLPQRLKTSMYDAFANDHSPLSTRISPVRTIFRLPFGLALKVVPGNNTVEADALRFIDSQHGIHTPLVVDSATSPNKSYLLTTWIEGQNVGEIWDTLSASDKAGIVSDLGDQFRVMRLQTWSPSHHLICNASGGPIDDPRVPWLAENPRTFSRCQSFAEEVWTGLDWQNNKNTLQPFLKPLIERDVPIVFSHGDLLPKNLIFPGGLDCWRSGFSRICVLDWEYAGWMPLYWDALKMTWTQVEQDDDWLQMARAVFPECRNELDADWEWRSRSGVLIL
ncbi:hypothetical protein Hypma_001942 [Hypsizygus marmoreus]|uniref:Aminoglycoside phosphotransferase domain-containing protein n=1 Tax=Hypsizygus marmoreus TaxID=39966 RepID=A0A369J7C6_HYPMA|nr:hypothetical protein Hypma_001942 [Hypsizygus marmoreus]